ncbi:double hit isoform b [Anaeramoeba flamelloides]|uniref:Double hit isoform b n=1 Tax=Anaeramoeba flamelloides TaxID=1746091 RepID=A0AAV7YPM4_9EUKA|nr:double hit isoform b [Anaeramoeba flamelloides]
MFSTTKILTTDGEFTGFDNEMIDIFNIDVKLKNVETQFYRKRSRYSERVMFFGLVILTILFFIFALPLYFFTPIKDSDNCNLSKSNSGTDIMSAIYLLNFLIVIIMVFLIRKVKEDSFVKKELFLLTAIQFVWMVFWVILEYENIQEGLCLTAIIGTFLYSLIYMVVPIYYSSVKEKKKKTKQKDESESINDFQYFENILNSKENVKYWIEWSKLNYSIENISFYQFVRTYEKIKKGSKKKKRLSKNIMETFITESSPLQINISYKVRKKLSDNYKSNPIEINLFADAKKEIVDLMLRNSYPLFLESQFFFEMKLAEKKIDPNSFLNVGKEDDASSVDSKKNVGKDTIELEETSNQNENNESSSSSAISNKNPISNSDSDPNSNSNSNSDSNSDSDSD